MDISQKLAAPLVSLACIFTLGCCVGSSFLLFRRFRKGVPLLGVVLLLLINCCASGVFLRLLVGAAPALLLWLNWAMIATDSSSRW